MSFSFSAIGTRDDILAQLERANVAAGNEIGELVRDALIKMFGQEEDRSAGAGYEYRWAVSASGHSGGGSPVSLTVTVAPQWVPVTGADP